MSLDFQTDFKIDQSVTSSTGQRAERVSLKLSTSGDIVLTNKQDKLAQQILRSLVNDQTLLSTLLNTNNNNVKSIKTLVTLILRNFRSEQILETRKNDPNLIGFSIYRFNGTQNAFVRISPDSIQSKFIDTSVSNGIQYTYGIKTMSYDNIESAIIEKLVVTPTQFSTRCEPVIGSVFTAIPGNKAVTFYVDYNRLFSKEELLETIENLVVGQDPNELRKWYIEVTVRSLADKKVSISSQRFSITGQ